MKYHNYASEAQNKLKIGERPELSGAVVPHSKTDSHRVKTAPGTRKSLLQNSSSKFNENVVRA